MNITAIVEALVAAGATPEMILSAVRAAEAAKEDALEKRRSSDRERQARKRQKDHPSRDVTLCHSDSKRSDPRARVEDITSNLDISGNKNSGSSEPSPEPKPGKSGSSKSSKGTRLSETFEPDIGYALQFGFSEQSARLEVEKFRDWWKAAPGSKGLKSDWPATWRTWIRNAAERSGNGHLRLVNGHGPPKPKSQNERIQERLMRGG